MFNFKIIGILIIIMLVMLGGFYWYYQDSQSKIAILIENNSKLEIAVQTNEATITELQNNYLRITSEIERVNTEFQSIRQENVTLRDRLAKHDIGTLGQAKPALVERVINNASTNAKRCFELLSGVPLNEKERKAKNANSFNSECPWLWNNGQQ